MTRDSRRATNAAGTSPRIVDLADVDPSEPAAFGGKACGLAGLLRFGARVPEGFAVEATCVLLDEWTAPARAALRDRAAGLLWGGAVAVRSSAAGEDSADKSFAGLFETVLDVRTADDVLAAAERCIASGRAERVTAYAGGRVLPVGLVVQRLVDARAAGVCFTVDPAGRDGAVVIEAVAGTGDRLVSGRVQPERWRSYRSALGRWEIQRDGTGPETVLEDEELRTIAGQAAAFAERFGHPLDLEWAIDARGLFWLQARPVTAAVSPPVWVIERYFEDVDDGPVTVWANWNVREVMPDPLVPLNWTLWKQVVLPSVVEFLFGVPRWSRLYPVVAGLDLVHGRVYWNMNGMLSSPFSRHLFMRMLHVIDARAESVTKRLVSEGVLTPRRLPASSVVIVTAMLWASAKSAMRVLAALRPRKTLRDLETFGAEAAARPEVSSLTDAQLLDEMTLLDTPSAEPLRKGMQAMGLGMAFFAAAQHAFRGEPDARRLLAAGIAGNPTTEISLGVDALVEAARPVASLFAESLPTADLLHRLEATPDAAAWIREWRAFLARYGQRCPGEFDIATPRWAEDPTMIVDLVRAGLRASASGNAAVGSRLERLARERRAAVDAAAARASWHRRRWLRLLARMVELYMPLREAPKHYAMFVFQRMRLAALELGARLVTRGVIDSRDDVFFLEWAEVQELAHGRGTDREHRPRVRARREAFTLFRAQPAPDFLRSDGVPVQEDEKPVEPGVLQGVGASAGRASGPVRVLSAPDPSAMNDGDVIVVEFADPGWTPLFPRARAVVMEVGGAMCHAAVIARELGIPAVFGVKGATRLLKDGEQVTVDGDHGKVTTGANRGTAVPPPYVGEDRRGGR
jgi:pyruvate,water dikinase